MSLRDSKNGVLTTIGSYVSLIQKINNTESTSIFSSINNSKDIVPYMLDTLKVVVGTDAIKDMVGELFTTFVDNVEPQLKTALKTQLTQYNANDGMPTWFTSGVGVSIPVKDIDLFGKLKTSPDSEVGSLLYDTAVNNFDSVLYDTILNNGTTLSYNNLDMNYDSVTDKITFNSNVSGNIGDWLADYIDDAVIINKKEFLTKVMNGIYGSISTNQNKTEEELYNELMVNKLIEQVINDDDSFTISQDDFDILLQKAKELQEGIVYDDMGCGLLGSTLPLSGMTNLISKISGATDSFFVANQVDATIDESTSNQDVTDENRETIKDGFFQKIIRIITEMLAQIMTTSPQIRALLAIISAFQNNVTKIQNAIDDMGDFKVFLKCVIDDAMAAINKFIFDKVVSYLVELIKPVIKEVVQEKINQYVGIVKSLVPLKII